MTKIKFEETTIPANMCSKVQRDAGWVLMPVMPKMLMEIMLSSSVSYLKQNLGDDNAMAIIFTDEQEKALLAVVARNHQSENAGEPGNMSLELVVDMDDISDIPEAKKVLFTDETFMPLFDITSYKMYRATYGSAEFSIGLIRALLGELFLWLDTNAKAEEEVTIDLVGFAEFTVGVEDGQKVMSFVPSGELKREIKDDKKLEEEAK